MSQTLDLTGLSMAAIAKLEASAHDYRLNDVIDEYDDKFLDQSADEWIAEWRAFISRQIGRQPNLDVSRESFYEGREG